MIAFFKNVLASLTGFILGVVLIFLFFLAVIATAIATSDKEEKIEPNTVLELSLNGEVPERFQQNPFENFGQDVTTAGVGLDQVLFGLDKAAKDKKIKGIYLRCDLYAGGMGTADEIREKILAFRKSGKFVIAYAEAMTDAAYFIASACDKVYLNPKGLIEFNGFAGQVMMYKGMFDKLGVEFVVFKVGKYKSAVEPFIQEKISEANRKQIEVYVNELFGHCMKKISESRKIDSGELADIANQYKARNAKKAVEYKLVDGLKYEDEVESELKTLCGLKTDAKLQKKSFAKYSKKQDLGVDKNKIAVIFANGEINMGKNESGDGIGSESLAATIKKARLDKNIKAVVLRVNSPGGSSNASDIIAREIELCKKVKPVIASYGDVAASGGYYISCLADSIFASRSSITGSIGVFALLPNTAKLYKDKMGLSYETVPTGEFAVAWRPDEPLSSGMRVLMQETVNDIYSDFISIVGKGRRMDTSRVDELAEGRVYTGIHAKEVGLIDGFGGLQRAIQSAANKAGLKSYELVNMPKQKDIIEQFFGTDKLEEAQSKMIEKELGKLALPYNEIKSVLNRNGVQMRLPYDLQIK